MTLLGSPAIQGRPREWAGKQYRNRHTGGVCVVRWCTLAWVYAERLDRSGCPRSGFHVHYRTFKKHWEQVEEEELT